MAWSAPSSVGPVGKQFGQDSLEVKSPASEATQPGSVTAEPFVGFTSVCCDMGIILV